ncbi:hypothetical protein BC938DRAFT_475837 [Jimgerdemannia flammicorona]|uniref:Uncharacterized protein n=1 Tax=Jimgerdemannia flammicorona TaxID=994334 RepID=A0A433QZ98_9FUNG|nr:hypothetical protein BC938DRAFT_475837 [Jimgerdemannia flammicorona]
MLSHHRFHARGSDMTISELIDMDGDPPKRKPEKNSEDEYEIDLGAQVDRTTAEGRSCFPSNLRRLPCFRSFTSFYPFSHHITATRIVKKTFSPTVDLTQRSYRSWTDGTQAAFFGRFVEPRDSSPKQHLVRDRGVGAAYRPDGALFGAR